MKTAVLYTRVDRKEVADPKESIAGQEEELRKYCLENNIQVVEVIREVAQGKTFDRPEFSKLYLSIVFRQIKADYLHFTTIDKFCLDLDSFRGMHDHLVSLGITPKGIRRMEVYFIEINMKKS